MGSEEHPDTEELAPPACEGEHLAYFFFSLPEPLALPEGFVVESLGDITPGYLRDLHESFGEDHGEVVSDAPLLASTRIWHVAVPVDIVARYEIQPSIDAAHRALPMLDGPGDTEPTTPDDGSSESVRTVVEVLTALPIEQADPGESALEQGIAAVRSIQRAYYLATKHPVTLVSRENIQTAVPTAVRCITEAEDRWPTGLDVYQANTNAPSWTGIDDREVLDEQEMEAFRDALMIGHVGPFVPFAELMGEARQALLVRGDYRAAAIEFCCAGEALLDRLLLHMVWEEGYEPERAAEEFFEGQRFASRVKAHFHDRLRGNWSLDGNGPIARWYRDVAQIRHRVVHAAYAPTASEANAAYDAARALEDFITGRVTIRRFMKSYPRTTLSLMGIPELQRRGRWSTELDRLMNDPDEPPWRETFARWLWVVNDHGSDGPEPPEGEMVAVLVAREGDEPTWYLHDRERRRVRLSSPPPDLTNAAYESQVTHAEELLAEADPGEPVSIVWIGESSEPLSDAEWVREHKVLPFHGVMVDASDLA